MYGCKHIVEIELDPAQLPWGVAAPCVSVYNDDDSFYVQYLTSRDEVDQLITDLEAAAIKAWGHRK